MWNKRPRIFVNLVKTILDGSVIISNYQKEHD